MGQGGLVFSGPELLCKSIERTGVFAEVADVEYSLRAGKLESGEVGIETCFWASEIGDSGGS